MSVWEGAAAVQVQRPPAPEGRLHWPDIKVSDRNYTAAVRSRIYVQSGLGFLSISAAVPPIKQLHLETNRDGPDQLVDCVSECHGPAEVLARAVHGSKYLPPGHRSHSRLQTPDHVICTVRNEIRW